LVFYGCNAVTFDFVPLWEVAAGPLIELDAEGCLFKALNGQYRGRRAFAIAPWLANSAAYGIDLFVGKGGYSLDIGDSLLNV
jgi:hypothetical protein